eukprot:PhF_6_TR581/c2_g1_i2/m.623
MVSKKSPTLPLFFVVLVLVSTSVNALSDCTEDDKGYTFTECDTVTQSRLAVQYWMRPCIDSGIVTTLKAPMQAPCDLECVSGTFYSAKFIGCERCPDGYSSSRSIDLNNFSVWPAQLTTYCTPDPCQPWQPSPTGAYLISGNQSIGVRRNVLTDVEDEAVVSVLKFQSQIVTTDGGIFRIVYRVESEEMFDGLAVYVNNVRQTYDHTPYLASGFQQLWLEKTIPLPYGMVEVRLQYEKDSGKSSYRSKKIGQDAAFIREIYIFGTKTYVTDCTVCPPGTYGTLTRHDCKPCPENTYSPGGLMSCLPCPNGTYSTGGSASCLDRQPCVLNVDYTSKFSRCTPKSTRAVSYELTNPYCVETSGTRPASGSLPCSACLSGMFPSNNVCIACPEGKYLSGSCLRCGPGSAAIPSFTLPDFDSLDGDLAKFAFQGSCLGDCNKKKSTWVTTTRREKGNNAVVMSSGELGYQALTTLSLRVNMISAGYIAFKYYFYTRFATPEMMKQISAIFYINGTARPLDITKTSILDPGMFNSDWIPAGVYDLEWTFRKDFVSEQIYFELRSLEVVGDTRGGASKCFDCQRGFMCPGNTSAMIPCPLGTFANSLRSTTCTPCADGQVASAVASTTCHECPPNTIAIGNNSRCVPVCQYTNGSFSYDLRPLGSLVFGPTFRSGQAILPADAADALTVERTFFSVCDYYTQSTDTCLSTPGFGCVRYSVNRSFSFGSLISVETAGYAGVRLTLSNGDACGLADRRRSALIFLRCDTDRSSIVSQVTYFGEDPPCQYRMEAFTPFACPTCSTDSYMPAYGPCKAGGIRDQFWVKKPEAQGCAGGAEPPATITVPCDLCTAKDYVSVWGPCDERKIQSKVFSLKPNATCTETPSTMPKPETQSCESILQQVADSPFVIVIVFAIVGFSILIIAVGFLIHRSKQEEAKKALMAVDAAEEGKLHNESPPQELSTQPAPKSPQPRSPQTKSPAKASGPVDDAPSPKDAPSPSPKP